MTGRTISHYRILEKLGEGGMGVVYKAEDTRLKRVVALKFLRPEVLESEEHKTRFLHEAQAAAALDHPNICTIHEIDEAKGQTFIAMAYVDGPSLKQKIEQRPLKLDEALDLAIQTGQGLEAAHKKGITHRDIKSANVMVTEEGQVKVMDFGLAHLAGRTKLTRTGSTLGTPAYMSPEQVRGEDVDRRADIWSLGVVLYEMVGGQLPFKGEVEQAVMYAILNEDPEPLTALRSKVPIELDRVVGKAMAKTADERYQHVADMLVDLRSMQRRPSVAEAPETLPSIAVLPFVNMSRDEEDEYFSDGLTEELINALTQLEGLRVVSRTSVFRFKGVTEDICEVGKKLRAGTALEGSVRRAGNRLRITAQLINVADGYHLWSQRFDREMKDIFDVQDEISRAIVEKLKVKLVGEQKQRLVKPYTGSPEAYELCLKGRYYYFKFTRENIKKSIEYFEKARIEDPGCALAYALLALAHAGLAILGWAPPREVMPIAKREALRALEIDESIAEPHTALAMVRHWYEWDWAGAKSEFRRGIELNPGDVTAYTRYAQHLVLTGRLEESIGQANRAVKLDPVSLETNRVLALVFSFARRYDEAIDQCRKTLELEPNFYWPYFVLGYAYGAKGRHQEARRAAEQARSLGPGEPLCEGLLGRVLAGAGERAEAIEILEELMKRRTEAYFPASIVSWIYTGLGDKDEALQWLDAAYEERDSLLAIVKADPINDPLCSDPRFTALLKKMGLES